MAYLPITNKIRNAGTITLPIRNEFVTMKNGNFLLNSQPFRFVGVNKYPLIINYMTQTDMDTFFLACARRGISVVRTWLFDTQGFRQLFYPTGTNLISNPSFETNTTGWTLGGDFTRVNTDAEDGSWSAKQVSGGGFSSMAYTVTGLTTSTNYILTFWHKTTNSGGFPDICFVGTTQGDNSIKDAGFIGDTSGTWQKFQTSFNSGARTSVVVTLGNFGGNVTAFFDNFNVSIPGSPPVLEANEIQLRQADLALAEARKYGVRLLLSLMDSNENNYNSKSQYVQWANAIYGDSFPNTYPYFDFFTSSHCQTIYQGFVDLVTGRVNTITGLTYRNDPTIFAWELGNELRANMFEGGTVNTLQSTNLAAICNPHPPGTNVGVEVLPNTSFETDTANWTLDSGFTRSNDDAQAGTWSIKQVSTGGTLNFTTQNDTNHELSVIPGGSYVLTFYYKLTITSGFGPIIEIHDSTPFAGNIVTSTTLVAQANWTQQTISFTAPVSGVVSIRLYNNNGNVVAHYDNFSLKQVASYNGWADIMSTYIKSKDTNHLVGFGGMSHGWAYANNDTVWNGTFYGVDYNLLSALPNIDYLDFHTYPNQGDGVHLQGYGQYLGNPNAVSGAGFTAQLQDFVKVAKANGKPCVCGEVGFVRETIGDNTYYPMYPRTNTFTSIFNTLFNAGADGVILWHGEVNDSGTYSINLVGWDGNITNLNYNDTQLQTNIQNENAPQLRGVG